MAVSLVIAYNRILEDDKEERNKVDKLFTEYKTNKPKRDNQRTKKKVKQTKRKKSDEREISDDDDYLITEKQVSRGGIAGR